MAMLVRRPYPFVHRPAWSHLDLNKWIALFNWSTKEVFLLQCIGWTCARISIQMNIFRRMWAEFALRKNMIIFWQIILSHSKSSFIIDQRNKFNIQFFFHILVQSLCAHFANQMHAKSGTSKSGTIPLAFIDSNGPMTCLHTYMLEWKQETDPIMKIIMFLRRIFRLEQIFPKNMLTKLGPPLYKLF